MDDEELWHAAVAGDGPSFGVFFTRHRDRVFRHLLRFVEQGVEAEDLTATVFLELWRTRGRVRIVDGSLVPWLIAEHDGGQAPDLVSVIGITPAGGAVNGYARASDLNDFGPEWPGQPSTPDEAMAWQTARDAKYPNGWDIPVFDDDGTTRIGTFHIGN